MQKGTISVQTENIFPIIKKFLYSDHEIFLRELVSNATDASSKLKTLAARGEFNGELGDLTIQVITDKENKTLTIRDKGIGMTAEEVQKYLNQVAFSSAREFLEKYKEESSIIGNFGLGFYSAFMVAGKVEVKTLSFKEGAEPVLWSCEGNPEYTLDTCEKADRGTDIILHINEEDNEFLEDDRIEGLLTKYCRFLPFPIQFGTKKVRVNEGGSEGEGESVGVKGSEGGSEGEEREVPNIINNPNPLWKKVPTDLKDEDYKAFYKELYPFSPDPLFWIHLNIDFPFNLTGVLYFPPVGNSIEIQKNKIQLYSNQVYVTDDVSQIVPEFLTLLHGVIDSPDIPLNVSRSYLQSDRNVKKITGYITKKVADKLEELFKSDRKDFEGKWKDLNVFIKYGMITDDAFYDKGVKFALLENVDGNFATIEEYKEKVKEAQTDKYEKIVLLYTHNKEEHHSLIELAKTRQYDVLVFDNVIDNHFLQQLEYKVGGITFIRLDSDTLDNLVQKDETRESVLSEGDQGKVKDLFSKVLGDEAHRVDLKALTPDDHPVMITRPEFMRRMKEMQMLQGQQMGEFPDSYNVVVNTNHPLITEKLLRMRNDEKKENFVQYLYNLARLNQNMLKGSDLTRFVKKSIDLLSGN